MKLFNEMAVICNESPDPGLEPLAGFQTGCPVQGAHQRLHLLDQVLNFVMRLGIDLKLRDAAHKIVQLVAVRLAGRPKLLLPHLREVLLIDLSVVPGDELLGAYG
jgi:hypothetical protein